MGKGTIISGGDDGIYTVRINLNTQKIDARISLINTRLNSISAELPSVGNELSGNESEIDAVAAQINTHIDEIAALDYAANPDEAEEEFKRLTKLITELLEQAYKLRQDYLAVLLRYNTLYAEQVQLTKELSELNSVPRYYDKEVSCTDYTTTLTGEVGLIEVPSELDAPKSGQPLSLVKIRPGSYEEGTAAYDGARDGIATKSDAMKTAETIYNYVMLPGWQKWYPRYRKATITSVNQTLNTANITISALWASHLPTVDLNQSLSFSNVPIEYMDCNASVFESGDEVIVEFVNQNIFAPLQNWQPENLKIIGFADGPKQCSRIGFVFLPGSDQAAYGWGEPYETITGTLINPPLGTPLSSSTTSDATFKQYRRVRRESGQWVVNHRQEWIGGSKYKIRNGRILSWDPVEGWETTTDVGEKGAPIFFEGRIIAQYPDGSPSQTHFILAVGATSTIRFGDIYAVVWDGSSDSVKIVSKSVDWQDPASTNGDWRESQEISLPEQYTNSNFLRSVKEHGSADINASCNELTMVGMGSANREYTESYDFYSWTEIRITWDASLYGSSEIINESFRTITDPSETGDMDDQSLSVTLYPGEIDLDRFSVCDCWSELDRANWLATPFISRSESYFGAYDASASAVVSAKYKTDSNELTRLIIKAEYIGSTTGYNIKQTFLASPDPGYLAIVGTTWSQRITRIYETKISVLKDSTLIESFNLWDKSTTSSISSEESCPVTFPQENYFSTSGSSTIKTNNLFIPSQYADALSGGFAYIYNHGAEWEITGSNYSYMNPLEYCDMITNGSNAVELTENRNATIGVTSKNNRHVTTKTLSIENTDELYNAYYVPLNQGLTLFEGADVSIRAAYAAEYWSDSVYYPEDATEARIMEDVDYRANLMQLLHNVTYGDYTGADNYTYAHVPTTLNYLDYRVCTRGYTPEEYDPYDFRTLRFGIYTSPNLFNRNWEILQLPNGDFVGQAYWKENDDPPLSIPIWSGGDLPALADLTGTEQSNRAAGYGKGLVTMGITQLE